jgi:hypothetical protein
MPIGAAAGSREAVSFNGILSGLLRPSGAAGEVLEDGAVRIESLSFVQGRCVLADLDISREAGRPWRGLVKEFTGVRVTPDLTVMLTLWVFAPMPEPVLCGIEVVTEGW